LTLPWTILTLWIGSLACTDSSSMFIPPGVDSGGIASTDTSDSDTTDTNNSDTNDTDKKEATDADKAQFASDAAAATCDTYDSCGYFNGYKKRLLECIDDRTEAYLEMVTSDSCDFQSSDTNECIALIYNWNCEELDGEGDEPWWLAGEIPACANICG